MERWTLTGVKIITPSRVIENGYITIADGKIADVDGGKPMCAGRCVDAGGAIAAPGLIDIHIHGSGGHWGFFDAKDLLEMAKFMPTLGVTAFCPATVSLPHATVVQSMKVIRDAMSKQQAGRDYSAAPDAAPETGARILGINLEGPYLSKKHPGAHNPMCIRSAKEDEIAQVLDAAGDALRIATIAPEEPGGMELTERLAKLGTVVSLGHSDATRAQTLEAVSRGARLVTHTFNAQRPFNHREAGLAFTAMNTPGVFCEIICDFVHVAADVIAMFAKLKSSAEVVLITDAISAAGLGAGKYNVWGFNIEVKDGAARMDNGTLAGSVLTLNRAVANMSAASGLPLHTCIGMATHNPARLLGLLPAAGQIAEGATADIALFDPSMNCLATIIAGHVVHRADGFAI